MTNYKDDNEKLMKMLYDAYSRILTLEEKRKKDMIDKLAEHMDELISSFNLKISLELKELTEEINKIKEKINNIEK